MALHFFIDVQASRAEFRIEVCQREVDGDRIHSDTLNEHSGGTLGVGGQLRVVSPPKVVVIDHG